MPKNRRKKTLFLGVFFDEISFPGQTVDFCLEHVIHIWKAMALIYSLAYQEIISVHPTMRQIFAGKTDSTFWKSDNESYQRNTLPVQLFPVPNKGDQLHMFSYLSSHLCVTVKYDDGQLASCQRSR